MATAISLDGTIDLNSLFNLTYNFDLLKGVIDALMKAQKTTNIKLMEQQDSAALKDKKMQE